MHETPIKVLVAEDETNLGEILKQFLTQRGHQVTVARDGRAALKALRTRPFDVALLDIVMPELDGIEVLRQVRTDPMPPECIIITGNGTIDTAIAAIRLGAYDYVSKPYRMAEIDVLVRRAWEKRQLTVDNRRLSTRLARVDAARDFHSVYAPMQAVLAMARRAATGSSAVLITGEPGSGKSELARFIHTHSPRAAGPIVDAVCASVVPGSGEAELCGVEHPAEADGEGAPSTGLIELAAGGTLVLDDVGYLDAAAQSVLADALAHGSFRRVGARSRLEVEARMIATSSVDLSSAVRANAFRSDLLHRLSHVTIALPPLRERVVDLPMLAQAFLRDLAGGRAPTLAAEAIDALQRYGWPRNLRELRNVLERAVLLVGEGIIHAHDLPLPSVANADDAPLTLAEVERRHIAAVLSRANWHQGKAATQLGISAKTLYRKIREYGFQRPPGSVL